MKIGCKLERAYSLGVGPLSPIFCLCDARFLDWRSMCLFQEIVSPSLPAIKRSNGRPSREEMATAMLFCRLAGEHSLAVKRRRWGVKCGGVIGLLSLMGRYLPRSWTLDGVQSPSSSLIPHLILYCCIGSGRVAPDRRWFGNTRVIKQEELDKFREEMSTR